MRRYLIRLLPTLALLCLAAGCATQAPGLSGDEIDELVSRAMQDFGVPGAAVGVIKDGAVVHAAGYGVRELGRPEPVDAKTLFRVASTTKAMTAASLAILVDEGRLGWDDMVVDYLPGFRMHDPWITQEFTVTDLLTHRSGLGAYAGDLMLWPKPNSFTRADIIASLRYFEAASGFRARYAYDNQLYIVAGEIVPAVTGVAWEDFVDQRIFAPLGTERCFAGAIPAGEFDNLAAPHVAVEGRLEVVDRNRIDPGVSVAAAAGGVRCSLADMLKWVRLQLNRGQLPDGSRVYSEQQARAMWSPQTILGVGEEAYARDRTHFRAYGLG
jgi:CubicO group peptidase (beta-lactamase class C family)